LNNLGQKISWQDNSRKFVDLLTDNTSFVQIGLIICPLRFYCFKIMTLVKYSEIFGNSDYHKWKTVGNHWPKFMEKTTGLYPRKMLVSRILKFLEH